MKRRAFELGGYNLGGSSYKSDVFKKPIISHAISSDHAGTTTDLPLFDPTTSRSQNIGHSNTATDCGHKSWPSESDHVSKNNVKHKLATASDLVPVEQPERLAKTIPDAEQQAKNNR